MTPGHSRSLPHAFRGAQGAEPAVSPCGGDRRRRITVSLNRVHEFGNTILQSSSPCLVEIKEPGHVTREVAKKVFLTVVPPGFLVRILGLDPFRRKRRLFFDVAGPIKKLKVCDTVGAIHENVYFLGSYPSVVKALSGETAPREDVVDVVLMTLKVDKRRKQRQQTECSPISNPHVGKVFDLLRQEFQAALSR